MNSPVSTTLNPKRWISNGSDTRALICAAKQITEVTSDRVKMRTRSRSKGTIGAARGRSCFSSAQPTINPTPICSSAMAVAS